MRHLPNNKSPKQNVIIRAVFDYYGTGATAEDKKSVRRVALWVMGRRKGIVLTEEERSNLWAIKTNLADKVYIEGLTE